MNRNNGRKKDQRLYYVLLALKAHKESKPTLFLLHDFGANAIDNGTCMASTGLLRGFLHYSVEPLEGVPRLMHGCPPASVWAPYKHCGGHKLRRVRRVQLGRAVLRAHGKGGVVLRYIVLRRERLGFPSEVCG
ncbi:hypothetical protein VNO78_11971 [Psophocarpus tetragonolobus]|uniref:Uncharacterized protein n=1 Tax=Psophocarpus tetragonolobus TaxID=3891 RepID=A0AAN9SNA8_PSOTE